MAKMSASATTVFCPPLSCFMDMVSPPRAKATRTLTPMYFSTLAPSPAAPSPPAGASSSSSSTPSMSSARRFFCITSCPCPPATSSPNTSLKFLATCLNVLSMASSFLRSSAEMSSRIFSSPRLSSSCRLWSSSRCSVKFMYWSSAFLFTCPYFFRLSLQRASILCSSLSVFWRYFSKASLGREPSSRIFFMSSSRFCRRRLRRAMRVSIDLASSCMERSSASSAALSSSRSSRRSRTRRRASSSLASTSSCRTEMSCTAAWASACASLRAASCASRSSTLCWEMLLCSSSWRLSRLLESSISTWRRCVSTSILRVRHATSCSLSLLISGLSSESRCRSAALSCALMSVASSARRSSTLCLKRVTASSMPARVRSLASTCLRVVSSFLRCSSRSFFSCAVPSRRCMIFASIFCTSPSTCEMVWSSSCRAAFCFLEPL
mmetsp:Transcript_18892/g.60683  ORF Transcript_18892/g.60683 Transcript_18892/m.60683 type:complete len:437 (-) Transcript_18892:1015-2325(-)